MAEASEVKILIVSGRYAYFPTRQYTILYSILLNLSTFYMFEIVIIKIKGVFNSGT